MGKKGKANILGRSLIKDRFGQSIGKRVQNDTMLHTTEIKDGYDWGRLNLQSVTEESSFQEFLRTAELAGTEFQAEKLNVKYVSLKSGYGLLNKFEKSELEEKHIANKNLLKIPRRPKWDKQTTPELLQQIENETFLNWRRNLAMIQEKENLLLTPYEKNIEFWRQLWRVIERSDVIVQIVDARNPLLFRSEDLEKYVKEIDSEKMNMILINKADLLTIEQRKIWAKYFDMIGIYIAFFSSVLNESNSDNPIDINNINNSLENENVKESIQNLVLSTNKIEEQLNIIEKKLENLKLLKKYNNYNILTRIELINLFKNIHKNPKQKDVTVIGLVGYPNVGKSSTINALMTEKKVAVSSTPGKTKHFQTLYLDKNLILCDCPGLVMPSFVLTKADMILNGILPIDQMRDYITPVNLLCNQIPRYILEDKYGIVIARPVEGEDPDRPPYAEELLLAYGYNRGFMTANGQPDQSRSARYILKDYVNGKLLYAYAPTKEMQDNFNKYPPRVRKVIEEHTLPKTQQRALRINIAPNSEDIDREFIRNNSTDVYIKGRSNFPHIRGNMKGETINTSDGFGKKYRHHKKEKREKLRKKFAHLDQH